jgi:hypothetical protein
VQEENEWPGKDKDTLSLWLKADTSKVAERKLLESQGLVETAGNVPRRCPVFYKCDVQTYSENTGTERPQEPETR